MSKRRLHAYAALLTVAIIWGVATPIIKYTLQGISPFPFLAFRFSIAAVFSIGIIAVNWHKYKTHFKHILPITTQSLLATASLVLLFFGIDNSTVLDTNIIATLSPLMIVLGGAIAFRDRVTHREKLGITIAVLGTILALFLPILMKPNETRITGNLFLLLALVGDVSAVLIAKWLMRKKVPPLLLASWSFIVGAIIVLPIVLHQTGAQNFIQQIITLELGYKIGVVYMALVSGIIAYTLYNRAAKSIEISEVSLFSYLNPVFSAPIAILWLGEKITQHLVLGAILIATGVFIAETKAKKKH
ncbi:DMT family transporter [Candidatus Microgenomates bacterium]|nr:MAG: DMT family transporter [Candidatus Microgenomates bacterium]